MGFVLIFGGSYNIFFVVFLFYIFKILNVVVILVFRGYLVRQFKYGQSVYVGLCIVDLVRNYVYDNLFYDFFIRY